MRPEQPGVVSNLAIAAFHCVTLAYFWPRD